MCHNLLTYRNNGWGNRGNNMKKLLATLVLGLFVALPFLVHTPTVAADEGEAKPTTTSEATPTSYSFTAQPDDNYTVLARKAVQIYGIENKVNLSAAQIVFAETRMTLEAGSPELNGSQKVEIKKDTVKSWVEKAQKLTDAQEKAWNYYVQFVDFDTRDNGEA